MGGDGGCRLGMDGKVGDGRGTMQVFLDGVILETFCLVMRGTLWGSPHTVSYFEAMHS